MRSSRILAVIVLSALFGVGACAQAQEAGAPADAPPAITLDRLLDNMEKTRLTIQTFQADVVKTRRVEVLDENETFKGRIEFKTPRLLRLDLTSDTTRRQIIYIVGPKYGWIYRPQEKQAERVTLKDIAPDQKGGNPLEYGLARDMHGLREGYTLSVAAMEKIGDAQTVGLEMTPKEDNRTAAGKVIFWICTESWLPVQVREFKSNNEIVETYTFSNIQLNKKVGDKQFEFEPGKEIDVMIHDAAQKTADQP